MTDNEEWRPVIGFSDYEVSSHGRVRSFYIENYPRILKPNIQGNRGGYLIVYLGRRSSERLAKRVHRLVLEAFVGPCPRGMQCTHVDGNPKNNRVDNLKWATPKENSADKLKHQTMHTKLPNWAPKVIRNLNREGIKSGALAEFFGVSPWTISDIVNNKTWRHI